MNTDSKFKQIDRECKNFAYLKGAEERLLNKTHAENERRIERILEKARETPEIMTAAQVAEFTGYSLQYIYYLVHRRRICFYKPNGGKIHFLNYEVMEWFHSRRGQRKHAELKEQNAQ